MEIVEFLTKNFYFILIALFFVARLFSNSGKKGKPPGRMPNFGGAPSLDEESRERRPEFQQRIDQDRPVEHPVVRSAEQQARPDTVYRSRMNTEKDHSDDVFPGTYRTAEASSRMSEKEYRTSSSDVHKSRLSSPRRTDNRFGGREIASPGSGLSKSELRKAFIWSEVLGAPKAKRSYRR